MATQKSYDWVQGLKRAFSAIETEIKKGNYISATAFVQRAEYLIPQQYQKHDTFSGTYDAAKTKPGPLKPMITYRMQH